MYEEKVAKESSAVNGEYEIMLGNEAWKIQNLMQILAKKEHPMSRFSCGNEKTLKKEGVTDALTTFFQE